jgi:hypothetical protein
MEIKAMESEEGDIEDNDPRGSKTCCGYIGINPSLP